MNGYKIYENGSNGQFVMVDTLSEVREYTDFTSKEITNLSKGKITRTADFTVIKY